MNICVFCSAQDVPEKYVLPARVFAKNLAERGHSLVWGGSNVGIMKIIADAAEGAGGRLIGVSTELFKHKARPDAHIMEVAKDLAERKDRLAYHADAFVALPGGIGTLDEVTEVLALRRNRAHEKPIIFLNTDNFYEGLRTQFTRMQKDGFLADRDHDHEGGIQDLVYFADDVDDALTYLSTYMHP
jgi:uncharacterized protein (TIGR00730 family)